MTRRPALAALGAAVLTGSAAIAWASLIERNLFTLRHHELPVLAPGSSPVRVLHLSDLHLVPGQDRKVGWVRDLARLEPDLVVNTGDNLAHLQAVPTALSAMAPLLERPGVFVLGSNDYFGPHLKNPALYLTRHHRKGLGRGPELPTQDLIDGFTSAGWRDLTHRRERLEVAGRAFELLGVDDPHLERDRYDLVAGPADGAGAPGSSAVSSSRSVSDSRDSGAPAPAPWSRSAAAQSGWSALSQPTTDGIPARRAAAVVPAPP